ncbi:MAG TPA: hypothetical protein VKU37_09895 [Verrucomicrobiae bacterium]|nr:hypothetical protein [Verrucomicrobiae bacterium]
MKMILRKIVLILAYLLAIQANHLSAQTNRPARLDSPQKQERIKRSVEMLRSAIDTNQLAIIKRKLISQLQSTNVTVTENGGEVITPEVGKEIILCFENSSKQMVSELNTFADLLANPTLKTYSYTWGEAEIPSPDRDQEKVKFQFRLNGPILTISRTTPNGELVHAQFGFDSKLNYFATTCREIEPFWFTEASFENDGQPDQLSSFSGIINGQLRFVFFEDRTGRLRFRMNHLEKLVHQRIN